MKLPTKPGLYLVDKNEPMKAGAFPLSVRFIYYNRSALMVAENIGQYGTPHAMFIQTDWTWTPLTLTEQQQTAIEPYLQRDKHEKANA